MFTQQIGISNDPTYIAENRARVRKVSTEPGLTSKYPYIGIAFDIPINARPVKPVGPTGMNMPGRKSGAGKPYCSSRWMYAEYIRNATIHPRPCTVTPATNIVVADAAGSDVASSLANVPASIVGKIGSSQLGVILCRVSRFGGAEKRYPYCAMASSKALAR